MRVGRQMIVLLVLSATAGSVLRAQELPGTDVLKAREAALAEGNTDGVLRLFSDDAVVVTSSGRFLRTSEQIGEWIRDQVSRRQREEAGRRYAQGTKLSWTGKVDREDWQKLGISPLEVRQDAIVEGGKIRFFNTTFSPESADKLEAARKKP